MPNPASVATGFALGADRFLGAAVTRAWIAHHRRRLARVGWLGALDADAGGWAAGDPPPRAGNLVEVLIDGAQALPRIAAEIELARSHVHIAGWFFSPQFALTRGAEPVVLRNLLAEAADRADVRVLAWAGAPLPVFTPSRGTVRTMRDDLCRGTRIRCALDARERPLHCHHEKSIVIDDRVAFVGGIDLTSEAGDRFDASAHRARATVGWHDVAPASQDQRSATSRSTSVPAGTRSRARRSALPTRSPPPVTSISRSFGPSRRPSTTGSPGETSGSSSRTCEPCARPGG